MKDNFYDIIGTNKIPLCWECDCQNCQMIITNNESIALYQCDRCNHLYARCICDNSTFPKVCYKNKKDRCPRI